MTDESSHHDRRTALYLLRRFLTFGVILSAMLPAWMLLAGALAQSGRMATSHDKHARLEALPAPRLVMIGGSNLHYGMDSPWVEEQLGRPVVNMGLQGSIGLNYTFADVADDLREGDWLVVALEQEQFSLIDPDGEGALYNLVSVRPQGFAHLDARQWVRIWRYGWLSVANNVGEAQVAVVRRVAGRRQFRSRCNEWGDYEGHKGKKSIYTPPSEARAQTPQDGAVEAMSRWVAALRERGVCVMVTYAPIASSTVPANRAELESAIAAFEPISRYEDYIWPDDAFFNTSHHLLFEKRRERAQRLVADIKRSGACGSYAIGR